jgi:phage terminase large subunit-like protein
MMMTSTVSDADLKEALNIAHFLETHAMFNKMSYFKPITRQREFLALGATKRERVFMAGNRVGKSETGAFEAACHATGDYPVWWTGKRFDHPTKGWVAGTTSLDVRNIAQTKLCGQYGVVRAFGTGFIPKERFVDKPSRTSGVTDAYDTIWVSHRTEGREDGVSSVSFKSYEQGRQKFQGETLDWGWCDEEAPMEEQNDVYTEFLTRVKGSGVMFITFTPLDGETALTDRFLRQKHQDREVVMLDLEDPEITWWTDEDKRRMIDSYPEWQRKARVHGMPILGSGAVFPFSEELIKCGPIDLREVPGHWACLWGIDFGIAHPFAAVYLIHDRDSDTIYVAKALRMSDAGPLQHAHAMRLISANAPVAWPHDGENREKGSGTPLAQLYRECGLKMLPKHATFEKVGGYSLEAGIAEMSQRMTTNRLKVASDLREWFEEFRSYHRKNGLIEKVRDDLLSATRIGMMQIRSAVHHVDSRNRRPVQQPREEDLPFGA